MSAFPQPLTAIAAPLLRDNVDTDTIIPSREMRSTGRTGLADGLFAPWRYCDADARVENPDFVLNAPAYRGAAIIAAGRNFGCGSSREHAVWAFAEYGVRAIVAESFAPIFRNNCIRNFLLPVALERAAVEAIAGREVKIDLAARTLACEGASYAFALEDEALEMLRHGLDAIDLTLQQRAAIDAWTAADRTARPWVYDLPARTQEPATP
ncbi:MAG: 3-isopropylmalate dehydratase small subunit [Erythrobacter sp.]